MGVFEFIVAMVLISTIGKVIAARQERPALQQAPQRPEEILQLNDAISELHSRVYKLEEERDFYRALLESPEARAARRPSGESQGSAAEGPPVRPAAGPTPPPAPPAGPPEES